MLTPSSRLHTRVLDCDFIPISLGTTDFSLNPLRSTVTPLQSSILSDCTPFFNHQSRMTALLDQRTSNQEATIRCSRPASVPACAGQFWKSNSVLSHCKDSKLALSVSSRSKLSSTTTHSSQSSLQQQLKSIISTSSSSDITLLDQLRTSPVHTSLATPPSSSNNGHGTLMNFPSEQAVQLSRSPSFTPLTVPLPTTKPAVVTPQVPSGISILEYAQASEMDNPVTKSTLQVNYRPIPSSTAAIAAPFFQSIATPSLANDDQQILTVYFPAPRLQHGHFVLDGLEDCVPMENLVLILVDSSGRILHTEQYFSNDRGTPNADFSRTGFHWRDYVDDIDLPDWDQYWSDIVSSSESSPVCLHNPIQRMSSVYRLNVRMQTIHSVRTLTLMAQSEPPPLTSTHWACLNLDRSRNELNPSLKSAVFVQYHHLLQTSTKSSPVADLLSRPSASVDQQQQPPLEHNVAAVVDSSSLASASTFDSVCPSITFHHHGAANTQDVVSLPNNNDEDTAQAVRADPPIPTSIRQLCGAFPYEEPHHRHIEQNDSNHEKNHECRRHHHHHHSHVHSHTHHCGVPSTATIFHPTVAPSTRIMTTQGSSDTSGPHHSGGTVSNAVTELNHHSKPIFGSNSVCLKSSQSSFSENDRLLIGRSCVAGSNRSSMSVNTDSRKYEERVMLLQNRLPPEAVQEIRQIWREIYGPTARDHVSSSSLTSVTDNNILSTSPSPSTTTAPPNARQLREYFGLRVRQVVHHYLGPNALTNANRLDDGVIQVKCSAVTTHRSPVSSAPTASLSSPMTVPSPRSAMNSYFTPTATILEATSQIGSTHIEVTTPNLQSTVKNLIPEVNKVSTPFTQSTPSHSCNQTTVTSVIFSDISTSSFSFNHSPVLTAAAPSVLSKQIPMMSSRRSSSSSSSSQCCMLEWLLSEEADLNLLPASFYDSKTSSTNSISTANSVGGEDYSPPNTSPMMSHRFSNLLPSPPKLINTKKPLSVQLSTSSGSINQMGSVLQSVLVSPDTPTIACSPSSSETFTTISHVQAIYPPLCSSERGSSHITPPFTTNDLIEKCSTPKNSLLVRLLHPALPNNQISCHTTTNLCPSSPCLSQSQTNRLPAQNHEAVLSPFTTTSSACYRSYESLVVKSHISCPSAANTHVTASRRVSGASSDGAQNFQTAQLDHNTGVITKNLQCSVVPITSLTQLLLQDLPSNNTSDSSDMDVTGRPAFVTKTSVSPILPCHNGLPSHLLPLETTPGSVLSTGSVIPASSRLDTETRPAQSCAIIPHYPHQPLPPNQYCSIPTSHFQTSSKSSLCQLLLDSQSGPESLMGINAAPPGSSDLLRDRKITVIRHQKAPETSSSLPDSVHENRDVYEFSDKITSPPAQIRNQFTTIVDSSEDDKSSPVSSIESCTSATPVRASYSSTLSPSSSRSSFSPKVNAEEVEFLYEILRRDELERVELSTRLSSHPQYSPKSKRSRLECDVQCELSSFRESSESEHIPHMVDGELNQADAQAVARICEKLQEGFTTTSRHASAPNGGSVYSSQVLGPSRLPLPSSFTSAPVVCRPSSHSSLDSFTPLTITPSLVWSTATEITHVTPKQQPSQAAVAAAWASHQAAATQRTKMVTQFELIKQRKRLLQHQRRNQITVYSHAPPSSSGSSNVVSPQLISPPPSIKTADINSSPGGHLVHFSTLPSPSNSNIFVGSVGEHSAAFRNTQSREKTPPSSLVSDESLTLMVTTALPLGSFAPSATPSIAGSNSLATGYNYNQHSPEHLSKFLKQVGPNVQVQLSTPSATIGCLALSAPSSLVQKVAGPNIPIGTYKPRINSQPSVNAPDLVTLSYGTRPCVDNSIIPIVSTPTSPGFPSSLTRIQPSRPQKRIHPNSTKIAASTTTYVSTPVSVVNPPPVYQLVHAQQTGVITEIYGKASPNQKNPNFVRTTAPTLLVLPPHGNNISEPSISLVGAPRLVYNLSDLPCTIQSDKVHITTTSSIYDPHRNASTATLDSVVSTSPAVEQSSYLALLDSTSVGGITNHLSSVSSNNLSNIIPNDNHIDLDDKPDESMIPEDIINDVFDLETMVHNKQHDHQSNYPFTSSNENMIITASTGIGVIYPGVPPPNTVPPSASSNPSPCCPHVSYQTLD